MKKRLIALLLVAVLLIPAGLASAAGWYRVNTSSLKVHYLAAENSKVLGSYRRDYAATVNSKSGDWSYVTFSNGVKGWVMSKYLSKGSTGSAWIYADNTNLRKGPDGGFAATAPRCPFLPGVRSTAMSAPVPSARAMWSTAC